MLRRFVFTHEEIYHCSFTKHIQSTKDATKFYEGKVEELGTNLKDLEKIVQGKSNNLQVVEDGKSRFSKHRGLMFDFLIFHSIATKGS